jgi:hypothetical protein
VVRSKKEDSMFDLDGVADIRIGADRFVATARGQLISLGAA